ncbi:hypothetical protein CCU68_02590 [Pseudomonas gingeri NCPPB 3146 = LMG 5327]|uniref:Lipoprotein n=2 Tax=Pseudomonas gingeri TaxID=117681 RepID=A0A7Y8CBR6_9PSED|nr:MULTISPECIES: hypothetical protein [Pseudomonas]NVZ29560.1 hypothetical protein [Pseudomonas gingeri]NVZ66642.1 hypothetical protein [Pseudomonas gingeri]NVZ75166.1 hypothetical protein [Pseudomonas gingeri]NWA08590.1 hypothetical protein [Pseudomonas gingeri]NWC12883.1 hypothetical protein [Pseudomonas gingeri]
MKALLLIIAGLPLVACGSDATPSAKTVLDALKANGVPFNAVSYPKRKPLSLLPNTYRERVEVAFPSIAPKGGQFFVCETREYCDYLQEHFQTLKALAGPHVYRSKSGRVLAQLYSTLEQPVANQIRAAIEEL